MKDRKVKKKKERSFKKGYKPDGESKQRGWRRVNMVDVLGRCVLKWEQLKSESNWDTL
jgi:hypothetical protein